VRCSELAVLYEAATNITPAGKAVHCYYCPNCTTHVGHEQTALGDKIVCRTILLKGGENFQPAAEIYGKDKLKWEPKVAETFDVLPPS
jgi:hypothetical protein